MKLLLLGADGQVGNALRESLRGMGNIVTSTRAGHGSDMACDLATLDAVDAMLSRVEPDVIVNAAAYTAVDRAEDDGEAAFILNARLPSHLGGWAAIHGAKLLHYSTDYVFDGTAVAPYPESAPTNPLGVYGGSKLEGERGIRASGCQHLILRTAWVYGPTGRNFLKTVIRLAGERERLDIVDDQYGTPTSAPWIASATRRILQGWTEAIPEGVYHLTASGMTTWCGFAQQIVTEGARRGLIKVAPEVQGISTAQYPTPARRPLYSVLDGTRVQAQFGIERPEWPALLQQVLDRMTSISDQPD